MRTATIRWMFLVVFLSGMSMPKAAPALDVGDRAPDFELPSTQGNQLKLSSFQNKKNVLLEFYVLDFTPT